MQWPSVFTVCDGWHTDKQRVTNAASLISPLRGDGKRAIESLLSYKRGRSTCMFVRAIRVSVKTYVGDV